VATKAPRAIRKPRSTPVSNSFMGMNPNSN
jgi:hypothetical protein